LPILHSRCTFTCALGALVSSTTDCVEVLSIRHYVTKLSETYNFLFESVVAGWGGGMQIRKFG